MGQEAHPVASIVMCALQTSTEPHHVWRGSVCSEARVIEGPHLLVIYYTWLLVSRVIHCQRSRGTSSSSLTPHVTHSDSIIISQCRECAIILEGQRQSMITRTEVQPGFHFSCHWLSGRKGAVDQRLLIYLSMHMLTDPE